MQNTDQFNLDQKQITIHEPCTSSANSIAVCYLEHSLHTGNSISIPSLGITIKQPSSSKPLCFGENE